MTTETRLEELVRKEWLETNGLGSYASGTAAGIRTRRYHGLFVAALDPPVQRHVLLSDFDETLFVDGEAFPLSTHSFRGAIHPEGYRLVDAFEARPVASWRYVVKGVEIERRVLLPQGKQAVLVTYRLQPTRRDVAVSLVARPLVAFRDFHALRSPKDVLDTAAIVERDVVSIRPNDSLPRLYFHHAARSFRAEPHWYRSFEYGLELERGYDGHEDLFSHGAFEFALDTTGRDPAFFLVSLDRVDRFGAEQANALEANELARRSERSFRASRGRSSFGAASRRSPAAESAPTFDRWAETFATRLSEAAEQFLATSPGGRRTVLAGYHWFSDWGRDTFIALPGLSAATGRWPLAFEVLRSYGAFLDRGMIPNRFPEEGTAPEYTSVDASLWFVEAARRYVRDSGDLDFARRELFDKIEDVLAWYQRGTRYGIGVDPDDGLLVAGAPGVALTWMDARVDETPVTARHGKAVEVNALWHNAICSAAELADALGNSDRAAEHRREAARVRTSFNERFWCAEYNWLFDVVDGADGADASLRPNQLFAISLYYDVLDPARRRAVVDAVEDRLLTPMGVRTLDPFHPAYRGQCAGDARARDLAYHNGTVWPWLLGPFASAYLKAHGRTPEARSRVRALVQPLARHLGMEGCLGQISEIADGDEPHAPRGCIAQAWSVAEVARVLVEEMMSEDPNG